MGDHEDRFRHTARRPGVAGPRSLSPAARAAILRSLASTRDAEMEDHHSLERDRSRGTRAEERSSDASRATAIERGVTRDSLLSQLRANEAEIEQIRGDERARRSRRRQRESALRATTQLIRRRANAEGPLSDGQTLPHELESAIRHLELTRTAARAYWAAIEAGAIHGTLQALINAGGRLGRQIVPGQNPHALGFAGRRPETEPTPLQAALDRGLLQRHGEHLEITDFLAELSSDEASYPGVEQIAASARRATYSVVRTRISVARILMWIEVGLNILLFVAPAAMALARRLARMRQVWLASRGIGVVVPASEAAGAIDATAFAERGTGAAASETAAAPPGTALSRRPGTTLATRGTDARLAAPRRTSATSRRGQPTPAGQSSATAGPNTSHGHEVLGIGNGAYMVRIRDAVRLAMQRVVQRKDNAGIRWLRPQTYGVWLHEELEIIVNQGGLRLPSVTRVHAETAMEAILRTSVSEATLGQRVEAFIDTLTHVPRAVRQRMRSIYAGRSTTVGRLQPDIVVEFENSYAIIDLTSQTELAHLAKSRLYQEIIALTGRARSTVEIYWRSIPTPPRP